MAFSTVFFFFSASKRWSDFKVHDLKTTSLGTHLLAGSWCLFGMMLAGDCLYLSTSILVMEGAFSQFFLFFLVAHNIGTLCNIFSWSFCWNLPPQPLFCWNVNLARPFLFKTTSRHHGEVLDRYVGGKVGRGLPGMLLHLAPVRPSTQRTWKDWIGGTFRGGFDAAGGRGGIFVGRKVTTGKNHPHDMWWCECCALSSRQKWVPMEMFFFEMFFSCFLAGFQVLLLFFF